MHYALWWTICTYAFGVYLISEDRLLRCRSALFLEPVAGNYIQTAPSMLLRAQTRRSASFTWARQLFAYELKLKMAVDAGRKWLPREKVMPGKPGGDDGDAHAADQSKSSPLMRPRSAVRNSPATHGRQVGMAGASALLAYFTLGWKTGSRSLFCFMFFSFYVQKSAFIKHIKSFNYNNYYIILYFLVLFYSLLLP